MYHWLMAINDHLWKEQYQGLSRHFVWFAVAFWNGMWLCIHVSTTAWLPGNILRELWKTGKIHIPLVVPFY
jgi:hypothetical protein